MIRRRAGGPADLKENMIHGEKRHELTPHTRRVRLRGVDLFPNDPGTCYPTAVPLTIMQAFANAPILARTTVLLALSLAPLAGLSPTAQAASPRTCERQAGKSLAACAKRVATQHRKCLKSLNRGCESNDRRIQRALDNLTNRIDSSCGSDAVVQATGFTALTLTAFQERLRTACLAEADALLARSTGGPHAPLWLNASADARTCMDRTLRQGARLLSSAARTQNRCIRMQRNGGNCRLDRVQARLARSRSSAATKITRTCDSPTLRDVIAIDPATFVERTAAQAQCLSATAHADVAPLSLDCGPRDAIIAPPRGQYLRIVLDEAEWGTRCGTGSSYAFWIRLAPTGFAVENVVLQMQGGGVCVFEDECNSVPAGLFSATDNNPPTGGIMSNDPAVSPFANWTKVYLPYCTQDLFIGGGNTNVWPSITVHRWGAINTRVALRYLRDILWRELDGDAEGYRSDRIRMLFGGTSAGGFGTLYNYHYVLDDLQWIHSTAWADSALALNNGELVGIGGLGLVLFNDTSGWSSLGYMPPYCRRLNCGVGAEIYAASAPRLRRQPEQSFLVLSNQVDNVQVSSSFFPSTADWINALRQSYCNSAGTNGLRYFLPAINASEHTIVTDTSIFAGFPVAGIEMRDWLDTAVNDPDTLADAVVEGSLATSIPGVAPFPCPVD